MLTLSRSFAVKPENDPAGASQVRSYIVMNSFDLNIGYRMKTAGAIFRNNISPTPDGGSLKHARFAHQTRAITSVIPDIRSKVGKLVAVLAVLAASLQPAIADTNCMFRAEKTAFDVRALQSQLMVAALTCGQTEEYNIFVQRHQRQIQDAYERIAVHFARLHRSTGELERDEYISELGNVHSLEGARKGPVFCTTIKPVVLQALTLQNPDEISRFVADQKVTNPYAPETCEAAQEEEALSKLEQLIKSIETSTHQPAKLQRPSKIESSSR